ncbi:MAG: alpha/beta fold hydrolase [Proteobacteria bacterium]|nr:alpha/beta fold hydrolase [Pseudomonadota bacterium]
MFKYALRYLAGASLLATFALPAFADNSATEDGLSLKQIMQDPDWIGNPPVNAYWSLDGNIVYFERKRNGESFNDQYALQLGTGDLEQLDAAALADINGPRGQYSLDGTRRVYLKDGDIFLADLEENNVRQVTRTAANEAAPFFMADDTRIAWRNGNAFYIFDPATGLVSQIAELKAEDDPSKEKPGFDYLKDQQTRLFATLREEKRKKEAEREYNRQRAANNPAQIDPAIYLGADVEIRDVSFSPAGRFVLVVTAPAKHDNGEQDKMPNFVTQSGYVEVRDVRTLVGLNEPPPHSLHLVDLETGKVSILATDTLPGIKDDPLKSLRKEAIAYHVENGGDRKQVEKALKAPDMRNVEFEGMAWSRDGSRVAVQAHSTDNKDRWIATIDLDDAKLETQHRLRDPAWINWYFNDFGWLPDNRTLWYLSEETGHSHLYVKEAGKRAKAVTSGKWVVSSPTLDRNGTFFYFVGSRNHPGETQIYRVPVKGGELQQLTTVGVEPTDRQRGGDFLAPFVLSPEETRVLFKHDAPTRPPELYVQTIGANDARQLTHTASEEFLSFDWMEPEMVEVPSSHGDEPVHARVYTPEDFDPSKKYPAVVFVHGAGYLHNVHKGWSVYFREFMFHNLLARHGYVVIDMDYRGSAGYGRDWRTAIYRQMGHPELEDLLDGVKWLAENRSVDPERVGIYGGSYGGFMTFMALFRAPDAFAAGAALRPVTDWMHYNHPYTSNILNTPLVDPTAYEKSSPIEFAEHYNNVPMLIAHGMQDDNVFFKDSVRLVQRLMELEKENYEIAPYPLDPHGFVHPKSWLDEYRRIFKLFEENVK